MTKENLSVHDSDSYLNDRYNELYPDVSNTSTTTVENEVEVKEVKPGFFKSLFLRREDLFSYCLTSVGFAILISFLSKYITENIFNVYDIYEFTSALAIVYFNVVVIWLGLLISDVYKSDFFKNSNQ